MPPHDFLERMWLTVEVETLNRLASAEPETVGEAGTCLACSSASFERYTCSHTGIRPWATACRLFSAGVASSSFVKCLS